MSSIFRFDGVEWWQMAGWTMVHFLWLGALVGGLSALCRIVLRRSGPNVRYVAAVASLGILTALPVGIAAWLASTGPATQVAAIAEGGAVFRGAESDSVRTPVGDSLLTSPNSSGQVVDLSGRDSVLLSDGDLSDVPGEVIASRAGRGAPIAIESEVAGSRVNDILGAAVPYLPWLWIVGSPLTFALLATGLVGTRRMRRASQVLASGPIVEACTRIARSLGVRRQVAIAACERVAAPVLVGILRPVILLPPAALLGWSPADVEMVLLHELAHVRRWDNLVNFLQRLVESLLFFHPAVWLVSNWVRREREACCDAIVVGHTNQPRAYAELLVAIAARLPRGALFAPAAASAMAAGPLRSRLRLILKMDDDPMLVRGKSFAILLGSLLAATLLAVLYLPGSGQAQESSAATSEIAKSKIAKTPTESTDNQQEAAKAEYPFEIHFDQGASQFADGDSIKVLDVRGTAAEFKPGNSYRIRGAYTLASRDRAHLSAFVTAQDSAQGTSTIQKTQTTLIDRGKGTFELILPMSCRGWPHVSLYPAEGGDGFGGIYFGTGDSRLTAWPGDKAAAGQSDEFVQAFTPETPMSDVLRAIDEAKTRGYNEVHFQSNKLIARRPKAMAADVAAPTEIRRLQLEFAPQVIDAFRKSLDALNDETRHDTQKYLEKAKELGSLSASDSRADIDLLLRQVADLLKQRSDLQAKIVQGQADFAAALEQLKDPALLKADVARILDKDPTLAYMQQQLAAAQAQYAAAQGAETRPTRATQGLQAKVSQLNDQINQYRVQMEQQIVSQNLGSPDSKKQTLQKLYQTQSSFQSQQLTSINNSLEKLKAELAKKLGKPADLETLDAKLTQEQELANDLTAKLQALEFAPSVAEAIKNPAKTTNSRAAGPSQRQALAGPETQENVKPADLEFYQRQMRFENGQLVITLTDAQMKTTTLRSRILSVVDVVAPSASVRMHGNELDIFGVDPESLTKIKDLIFWAFTSDRFSMGVNAPPQPNPFGGLGQRGGPGGLGTAAAATTNGLGAGAPPPTIGLGPAVTPATAEGNVARSVLDPATPSPDENVGRGALRYEGKTFDVWREAWQMELSPEKRLAALKALVAFGANGYGQQAAEAILDVTKLYDLSVADDSPTAMPVAQLKQQAVAAFGWEGDSQAIPWKDWLPAFEAKVRSGDAGSVLFANSVFLRLENSVGNRKSRIVPELLALSRDAQMRPIRAPILRVLSQFNLQKKDKQIEQRMVEALRNPDAEVVKAALSALYTQPFQHFQTQVQLAGGMNEGAAAAKPAFEAEYWPELAELLRDGDLSRNVRSSVFGALELIGPKAAPAVPDLLPITLEPPTGPVNWPAVAEQVIDQITGTDQTVYRYWHTIAVDDSMPAEKVERAKERIKNWEESNKRREEDLKRFNEGGPGRDGSRDPRGR